MMIDSKQYQNKEWLQQQYINLKRKVVDIAKKCGVSRITINRWLKKHNIPSRKFNDETLRIMSEANKGKNMGEKNHNWKGNNVSYTNLHVWIKKNKIKPENCEKCGKKKDYLELANISGKYKRNIDDYFYLCVRCHKEFDGTFEPFIEGGKNTRFKKGNIPWNLGLKKSKVMID